MQMSRERDEDKPARLRFSLNVPLPQGPMFIEEVCYIHGATCISDAVFWENRDRPVIYKDIGPDRSSLNYGADADWF